MTGTPLRKSLFTVALFAAVIAAAIGTVPAIAAPPQSATFAFEGEFDDPAGEFTSDGSIVCASGTTSDEFFASGFQSEQGIVLHDLKTVTCDDGSGSFTLLIQGRTGFNVGDGVTSGRWVVVAGTGDYADLHGRGTLNGVYTPIGAPEPTGTSEVYIGWLTL